MKKVISLILSIVMILSVLTALSSAETIYSDVKSDRWSIEYINYAVEQGYMNGVGGGKFNPAGTTTRAMAVTVLWRLCGSPDNGHKNNFKDVSDGKWYTTAVSWASNNNIVKGTSSTTFAPDSPITREQLAAIIYRFAAFDNVITDKKANIKGYSDYSKVSSYAVDALSWCVQNGLISGVTKTELQPKGNATREQFSAIMYRYDHAGYKFPETQTFKYEQVYNSPELISSYSEKEYPLMNNADIYVAVDGKDTNPGTLSSPVKTMAKAAELARAVKETKDGDVIVAFKGGNYGMVDRVNLTSADSGKDGNKIIYCAYGDGEVVFDNGASIDVSDFKSVSASEKSKFPESAVSDIKVVNLDKYFKNGLPDGADIYGASSPLWQARVPNRDANGKDNYFACLTDTMDDSVSNQFDMRLKTYNPLTKELKKYGDLTGVTMFGYIMFGWRVDKFIIKDFDAATGIVTLDDKLVPDEFYYYPGIGPIGIRTPQMDLDEIALENHPMFLNAEGEYWYDKDTNNLYVYKPTGSYSISIGGGFLTMDGVENVSLVNLTFKNTIGENAFEVYNSENITFDRLNVSGVTGGQNVIKVKNSNYFTVTGCEFSKFTGHCISYSKPNSFKSLESNHFVVDNNYFHDFGLSSTFSNCAIEDESVGGVISHNYFYNSPNNAINMGTLSTIEYNVFEQMMTSTQDFGIIYVWEGISVGRCNTIRYNVFRNTANRGAQYSIYLDDYTQEQYIYGNIFYESGTTGIMVHNSKDNHIFNNVFVGSSGVSLNGTGYYDGATGGLNKDLGEDGTNWQDTYDGYYYKPNEGEPYYEKWVETFPRLYEYTLDLKDASSPDSFFIHYNDIHDNMFIDAEFFYREESAAVSDFYNNTITDRKSESIFVDATHGNYTVREDSDFFKIPFDKIGRY